MTLYLPNFSLPYRMTESPTVRPARIPAATLVAAVLSALGNAALWAVAQAIGRMTIGVTEVVVASVIGAVLGGIAFAICGRFSTRPTKVFGVLTIIVVAVYAFGPVSAALAPYMEGAELFNATTVVATEVMHLLSAAAIWFSLTRLAHS